MYNRKERERREQELEEVRACALASGSSGNSFYIEGGNGKLLIDAGLSGKRITKNLEEIGVKPEELDGILITHEHRDHITGAGVLSRRFNLPIYATEKTWEAMGPCIGEIKPENRRVYDKKRGFEIKGFKVEPFDIPHDAVEPVGYSLFYNSKKISSATDIGHINRGLARKLDNSDLILLESNHDVEMLKVGPYPWPLKRRILGEKGHLSNEDAGKMAAWLARNKRVHVLLGHLSAENNFPELAYRTVASILQEKGINITKDIDLNVAYRDMRSAVFHI